MSKVSSMRAKFENKDAQSKPRKQWGSGASANNNNPKSSYNRPKAPPPPSRKKAPPRPSGSNNNNSAGEPGAAVNYPWSNRFGGSNNNNTNGNTAGNTTNKPAFVAKPKSKAKTKTNRNNGKSGGSVKVTGSESDKIDIKRKHFANIKLMIFFTFWLILILQGIYSMYYSEIMLTVLNVWSNDSNCLSSEFYSAKINDKSIYDLIDSSYDDGVSYFLGGFFGCIITLFLWVFWMSQINNINSEYGKSECYVIFNYWFGHILGLPIMTFIVYILQIGILNNFSGSLFVSLLLTTENGEYYYENSLEDDNCDGWDDFYNYSNNFLIVTFLSLISFIIHGIIIPIIITCVYCVRGKIVFKGFYDYQCWICCRPLLKYGIEEKLEPVCKPFNKLCCVD